MTDDIRTIAGSIYWPLYPFQIIRNEVLPLSSFDEKPLAGIYCPHLHIKTCNRDKQVPSCLLPGNSVCDKNKCFYKKYYEYHDCFLLNDIFSMSDLKIKTLKEKITVKKGAPTRIYTPWMNSKVMTKRVGWKI